MKSLPQDKQKGFTIFEILTTVLLLSIVLTLIKDYANDWKHRLDIQSAAADISLITRAVQKRNAHDGFTFEFWDTNGGRAATNATLSWAEANFNDFLDGYLVGHNNGVCGQVNGWNPVNTGGLPDVGAETAMERTALVNCSQFRNGNRPFNTEFSAALSPDASGIVDRFALYITTNNVDFGVMDKPDNNILNFQQLSGALRDALEDRVNGEPTVQYGLVNDLDDINDDTIYTRDECSAAITAGNSCSFIVYVEFAGTAVGLRKRTDNQDWFVDDVTFGDGIGGGRQRCNYWEEVAGNWNNTEVDCAIKAGANDAEVKVVVNELQAEGLFISNTANLNRECQLYEASGVANRGFEIANRAAPNTTSPCGITSEGGFIQLITDQVHASDVLATRSVTSVSYTATNIMYNPQIGATVLRVMDAANVATTFFVNNEGNTTVGGTLDVAGNAQFDQNVNVDGSLSVEDNATFSMTNGSQVLMGDGTSALTFNRPGVGEFTLEARGSSFDIINENSGQGIGIKTNGTSSEITLDAEDGVVLQANTRLHAVKSTLRNAEFNGGVINNEALKNLSEVVTADMAKYLDDTSSAVQIVGVDRIEGEFVQLTKPNCLAFADDANYSSADANPYRELIDSGVVDVNTGESLARLVLVPTFLKTYNAAFGDNQIYAQHASHSTATTWDIFLYLSGEGAFGTGAREDAAGGSLALIMCDYSSVDFSRQTL